MHVYVGLAFLHYDHVIGILVLVLAVIHDVTCVFARITQLGISYGQNALSVGVMNGVFIGWSTDLSDAFLWHNVKSEVMLCN